MNQSELCLCYMFQSTKSEADDVTAVHVQERGRGRHRGDRGRRDRGGIDHNRQPPSVQQDADTWRKVDDCSSTSIHLNPQCAVQPTS